MRNQRTAGGGDFLGSLAFGSIKGQGAGVGPVLQFGQPHAGELRVGKVLFVQQVELGFAARKLGQQWVLAGGGQTGIQHFDDHIGAFQPLDEGFFGFVHMAGKPLDAHDVFFL